MKYINVVGGPGSGKSSLARGLADALNIFYIELDSINWLENWESMGESKFRNEISTLISEHEDGWVVDGSYHQRLGELVRDKADTIVFLKIPLFITVPRVFVRSIRRIVTKELLWGKNQETLKGAMNLLWWTAKYHRERKAKMKQLAKELESTDTKYYEFTRNKHAREWLKDVTR